jgi:hypothetical protein
MGNTHSNFGAFFSCGLIVLVVGLLVFFGVISEFFRYHFVLPAPYFAGGLCLLYMLGTLLTEVVLSCFSVVSNTLIQQFRIDC